MKLTDRILVTTIAAALALPIAAFAAKANRKAAAEPLPAYETVDKDGTGGITEKEFVAALKDKLGEDGAKTKFASLDKNPADGKLTKEEYAAASTETKKRKKKNQ